MNAAFFPRFKFLLPPRTLLILHHLRLRLRGDYVKVSLETSLNKPLHTRWIINMCKHITTKKQIVMGHGNNRGSQKCY